MKNCLQKKRMYKIEIETKKKKCIKNMKVPKTEQGKIEN